ncbi:hypothetical protein ACLB2K_063767 [Fragaria x ananassa]
MEDVASNFRPSSSSYFTPLLISMAGIVSTTLAVIAYHFIVVKFCMRHRYRQRQRILEAFSNLSPQQNPNINQSGVDEKALSSIPTLSYSTKDGLTGLDQSECVICLGELEDGDMVRLLPNCKHVFHNPCIDIWFLAHTNCPICRAPIVAPIKTVEHLTADQETRDQEVQDQSSSVESLECSNSNSNLSSQSHEELRSLLSVQLAKPNGLLRNCVSLVLLPIDGSNKQQMFVNGLQRSLSLDPSHILINIQRECDDDHKPSSSSSSSSSSPPPHTRAVLVECGSFKERSFRQFDRMSTVLIQSLSQLRVGQSSSVANGHGILPC